MSPVALWIDSDIGLAPDDVEGLRNHQLPVVAGLYAKKARRELACKFLPGTSKVQFGSCGGLLEVMYAATEKEKGGKGKRGILL